ncbi:MAG: DUF4012 domain-containing protein [Parcubacteria group bacterium]
MKKVKSKTKKSIKRDKPVEPLTIGLLQHEIDEIIGRNLNRTDKELEKSVMLELAALLPKNETVSEEPKRNHHRILIKNISDQSHHSPHLLDLSGMLKKKKEKTAQKEKIRAFLNERGSNNSNRIINETKQEISRLKNIIAKRIIEVEEGLEPIFHEDKQFRTHKIHRQFTGKPLFYHFNLPLNWRRSFVVYVSLCLLVILPIKAFGYYQDVQKTKQQAISFANAAYEDLKIAGKAVADNDSSAAKKNFNQADNNFRLAAEKLDSIGLSLKTILKYLPTNSANLADAQYLLSVGSQISEIGKALAPVLSSFSGADGLKLTDRIAVFEDSLEKIEPKLSRANADLNKVRDSAVPDDKKQLFRQIKQYVGLLDSDVGEMRSFASAMRQILGQSRLRRYLFAFQNSNEIRPTGGFLGSFALVDVYQGGIKKMEIPGGGTYDMKGSLLANVASPYPLQLVNALWQMQDANWFPDFPTTAQKIEWFYSKSGGPSVDGVVAMNSSIIPKLLEITGPISLPKYGKTITADNFSVEIQKAVEFEYDKATNKPKQILADLAPELLKKIFANDNRNLMKIILAFKESLDNKDIQLYFNNAGLEEKMRSYGWTGEIKDTTRDYLSIVNANIGGYKTDNFIRQDASLVSSILADGSIIDTLTITRSHNGKPDDIFGGKSNIDFLRVYVPSGSRLISADGFSEIPADRFEPVDPSWKADEFLREVEGDILVDPQSNTQINGEFGKTVFGNWVQVDPGESKTVTLAYKLPFSIRTNRQGGLSIFSRQPAEQFYSLFLQKQSGQANAHYKISIASSGDQLLSPLYPADAAKRGSGVEFSTDLPADQLLAVTIK